MPLLEWDQVGDRTYETGLDRGVLYLADGTAIPWNGLTGVTESSEKESEPVYYDGVKINNLVGLGDFVATMKAITYPDEFIELEGQGRVRNGVWVADQEPQFFHLSYRTKVGNDLDGDDAGYKIHIIYNVLALPKDKLYATQSVSPSLVEFEWDISAIPEHIPGHRPTAHIILDSRELDPWLLEDLEEKLYGGEYKLAELPPMLELFDFIKNWYRWRVTDNGDGTYTLTSARDEQLVFTGTNSEIFQALGIYVETVAPGVVKIFDTYDIADVPKIKIIDNGDGSWTATTEVEGLFAVTPDGEFIINDANAYMIAVDAYRVSDSETN